MKIILSDQTCWVVITIITGFNKQKSRDAPNQSYIDES